MPKYTVLGEINCFIQYGIEIPQDKVDEILANEGCLKDYIIDKAYDEFGGVCGYAGNGGIDKLIGVSEYEASISASEEFTFDTVEDESGSEL